MSRFADRHFSLRIPADSRYLKPVRAFFAAALDDLELEEVDSVLLAMGEAAANVVRHRSGPDCGSDIELVVAIEDDVIRFEIRDYCRHTDLPNIRPRDLEEVRPGGLGTHFIGEIMDRVEYHHDETGSGWMVLVATRKLGSESEN